jgi:hypothetical protein
MKLNELFNQSSDSMEINFTEAEYIADSMDLEYVIHDLTVDMDDTVVKVENAGILKLNFDPTEFMGKLVDKLQAVPQSLDGMKLNKPLGDFTCEQGVSKPINVSTPYEISVEYTLEDGTKANTEITFNSSVFVPSREFAQKTK